MFDASLSALLDTAVAEATSGTGQAQATAALLESLGLTDPPTAIALRYAVAASGEAARVPDARHGGASDWSV